MNTHDGKWKLLLAELYWQNRRVGNRFCLGFCIVFYCNVTGYFFFLTYFLFSGDADVGDDSADGDAGEGH